MKTVFQHFLVLSLFIGSLLPANASAPAPLPVDSAIPTQTSPVGIGSILVDGSKREIFLGQVINHDGSPSSVMVLDKAADTIRYLPLSMTPPIHGGQALLKPYEQQGGTCTGYAIDQFLLQMHYSHFDGNGQLSADTSTEEKRAALLVDSVNEYYLVLQHQFSILGILNSYGKKYGFECRKKTFADAPSTRDFLFSMLKSGLPILISFNIGPDMTDGPFKLRQGSNKDLEDGRLWLPRQIGKRNSGGHSVVIAGAFTENSEDYLVMIDSDWNLPRVWKFTDVFTDRTAMGEIEFYTCQ